MATPSFTVTKLHRYPVKGLGADALETVQLHSHAFPDDRRYALWQTDKQEWRNDQWRHKENFMCAFTHPQLLARYETSYLIVKSCSSGDDDDPQQQHQRILTLKDRRTNQVPVGPLHLETETGRSALASFLSQQSNQPVRCITSCANGDFHFGNTATGVNKNGDPKARCMHVVFQATVDALAAKMGRPLRATRFRPNIVLQSREAAAFQEFAWIGKTLEATITTRDTSNDNGKNTASGGAARPRVKLKILNKTVRCQGVSVDPLDDPEHTVPLDIPELLMRHFPEHGPYLGVYCVLEEPGTLSLGDTLRLVGDD